MQVYKYTTKHLVCVYDGISKTHQIFENDKLECPVAIYINCRDLRLAEDFPSPETEYKYFAEMSEIITLLYENELSNR